MAQSVPSGSQTVIATNPTTPLMEKLLREKDIARKFQERKHADWQDNYELVRGKVKTNRLTQRQAVNIPLMRETEKTLLSKIDEPPNVVWKELSGDQNKEIILGAIWDDFYESKNLEAIDMQDKKTVLRYGRSTKKLVPNDKDIDVFALDVYDVVYDPMTDPLDIDSARFIIQQNIFRSLREILADDRYTEEGKEKLRIWAVTDYGMVQSQSNKEEWEKKMERLKGMGVSHSDFGSFAGGDVIVNLTEHYTTEWNSTKKEFERRVVVYAEDSLALLDEKLEDMIGMNEWPFVTWAEDLETTDLWVDSVDDLVRVPNKILNVWFSQLAENRTLKNFQMHWYDATKEGYKPQTYEPGPGRMLPAPGNPNETIMPVQVSGLEDTLTAIDFLIKIVERGSGATAIEKGVSEKKQITLGEVEMLVGKAMERTQAMAKFYRRGWYDFARKWLVMMENNVKGRKVLYKTDKEGKIWPKVVYPKDWISEKGYKPMVRSSSEQETETTKGIQRFQFLLSMFPNNPALRRIAQKRSLELVDLTPEELKEVEEAERQQEQMMMQQIQAGQVAQQPQPQPMLPPQ